jgi:hypothetical protein
MHSSPIRGHEPEFLEAARYADEYSLYTHTREVFGEIGAEDSVPRLVFENFTENHFVMDIVAKNPML